MNPQSRAAGEDVGTGSAWNGDGWKLAPFLSKVRPDMDYWTIDADQGIGVLARFSSFDGDSSTEIDEHKGLDYLTLCGNRTEVLRLTPPSAFEKILNGILKRS